VFKLVLCLDLVGTIEDKGREVVHMFHKDVTNFGDNSVRLLSLQQTLAQLGIDIINILDVVKDSIDESFPAGLGQNIKSPNRNDPFLIDAKQKVNQS